MSSQLETPGTGVLPIAVDAMGGDHGPSVVVEGAIMAARRDGISSILVGNQEEIDKLLSKYSSSDRSLISVHHASQFIQMDESPGLAIRGKPDSSIRVAFELVAAGKASAVVSPGNTGAIMAAGVFVGGTLPGIARPAIASLIPKGVGGTPTVLLDSGANTGCQAFQLVQFALMGNQYAKSALGIESPRVALLSNGTEVSKGNDIIRAAAMMLSEMEGVRFIGYVEGRDIARDVVDVVVCDGFVGNIVLKAMEGSVGLVVDSIKAAMEKSVRAKIGLWLAKPILKSVFKDKLDPSAYGGAPLLGLGHIAIKCHGSSKSRAVMNGIRVARKFVDESVLQQLHASLGHFDSKMGTADNDGGGNGWTRVFEKRAPSSGKDNKVGAQHRGGKHD